MFVSYIEFLGPKVWKCRAPLLIISWSEKLPEYALFFGQSVRSIWDTPSQNQKPNGQAKAKIRIQIFFWSKSFKTSGGQKGPLLTSSGAPNGLRWWPWVVLRGSCKKITKTKFSFSGVCWQSWNVSCILYLVANYKKNYWTFLKTPSQVGWKNALIFCFKQELYT